MILAIWFGVAVALASAARKTGPWWRVGSVSLAWPTFPFVAAVSKLRHTLRRRKHLA